ncbi:5'-nucleotidase surE [Quillaja saponaria]|uniref:5'-nucleotidase surE n=1 Tax=Quillaja saponaria TaxID=32244 RepID=A0AAD7L535_QUISA|nr:5'-nucleotidase surE [Quillaja saponaria]
MTSTSVKNNSLPPGLVSNLQEVLLSRKGGQEKEQSKDMDDNPEPSSTTETETVEANDNSKPVVLVTNSDGIESPGLTYLVEALVREGIYNVHVCAPQLDKSVSGHSVTLSETVAVSSAEISGATAYEVSGTPVDCVSLALSGALFSWSKPMLVISGINRGSNCGHHMFYSGVVAGAREAFLSGVPSVSISLNWKKDESQDSDFKDAVAVCLPLINAVMRDIEKGVFPKSCFLNVEVPTSPSSNKGFKLTKQSMWRSTPNWLAVSTNRYPAGHFMSNQQSLGLQLAQLGRDASAAGAARRLTTQKKNLEIIESIGAAGKSDSNRVKKYFRLEFLDKEQEDVDDDLDYRALQSGFIAVTPLSIFPNIETEIQTAAADWISAALNCEQ